MIKLNKLIDTLLVLIASFPLLGMRISIYLIAVWCFLVLLVSLKKRSYLILKKDWKQLLVLCSYYLMALISYFTFSFGSHEAYKDLETKAAFVVFPIFMFLSKNLINSKILNKVLISFVTSNILLAVYVWSLIFKTGFLELLESDSYYNPVFRNMFSDITQIHLPYLGLLFGFSSVILLHFFLKLPKKQYLLVVPMTILIVSMLIFSARMAVFSTVVVFVFYLINKTKRKIVIISFVGLILVLVSLFFLPPVKRRFAEFVDVKWELPNSNQQSNKVNFRYGIYHCSLKIIKENWAWGLGIGAVQDKLNYCYEGFDYENYDDFSRKQYNSHNQYLNAMMTYGVLGLIVFVYFLIYGFKSKDLLYSCFIILNLLGLMTENLFEREVGVMFFSFWNSLFFTSKNRFIL